ncbi:MAG: hypothetical protein Q6A85_13800 [Enterococcus mundtii]|nr:hypothetical protein [Enterococcus mundtii]
MTKFATTEEYMRYFQILLEQVKPDRNELRDYLTVQYEELKQLIAGLSEETFLQVNPKILGIDAKLALLSELLPFEDFSNEELIRFVEQDYQSYYKELCGYDLKTKTRPSMFFTIL